MIPENPRVPERRPLAATIARYASSKFYHQALGAVTAFLRPRLLSPELFGLWTLLRTVPTYAAYVHLGSRSAMRYSIPRHLASGDEEKVASVRDTVFSSSLVLNLVVAAGLVLAGFVLGFGLEVRVGLAAMAVYALLEFYHDYYVSLLKAHEKFALITSSRYVEATALFLFTIPLLLWLGLYGLFLSVILVDVLSIAYLRRSFRPGMRMRFDGAVFRELVAMGFPIMLSDLAFVLVYTSDRWVVSALLAPEDVGHYGIAILVVTFLRELPGTAREVIEPRLMGDVERRPAGEVLDEYVFKPMLVTAYLMPLLLAPVVLALPAAVRLVLPRYEAGIVPSQILALGVFFLALAFPLRAIFVAWNWQRRAALLLLSLLAANLASSVLFVKLGFGLPGVALASSLSFAVFFVAMFLLVARRTGWKDPRWRECALALSVPFPVLCGLAYLAARFVPGAIGNEFAAAALSVVLAEACLIALHRWASGRFPLLPPLRPGRSGPT
ncbi:MAG: oligosaccharide flippase family protein [Planctomycetes bacterium]|nr:oligosaccharide flippase family protein [Planctomycetota bacterium]